MKANHIYLRRLRDNDFEERFLEKEYRPRGATIQDFHSGCVNISKILASNKFQPVSFYKH